MGRNWAGSRGGPARCAPRPTKQQVTRVAVDDDTSRAFRQVALDRDLSVSSYLAKLVDAELRRRRAMPVANAPREEADAAATALAGLETVRLSIEDLDHIAGRRAPSALAHGAPWKDIASSLHLTPEAARDAYRDGPRRAR